jgi:uncharacterized protein HemX
MKARFLIVAALALGLGVSSVDAQIRHRAQNQHQRIRQGVKSGELTKGEAKNLRENQKDLRQDVKLAKSDGKITPGEKKIITKEENTDSREIYRKKHNGRVRP